MGRWDEWDEWDDEWRSGRERSESTGAAAGGGGDWGLVVVVTKLWGESMRSCLRLAVVMGGCDAFLGFHAMQQPKWRRRTEERHAYLQTREGACEKDWRRGGRGCGGATREAGTTAGELERMRRREEAEEEDEDEGRRGGGGGGDLVAMQIDVGLLLGDGAQENNGGNRRQQIGLRGHGTEKGECPRLSSSALLFVSLSSSYLFFLVSLLLRLSSSSSLFFLVSLLPRLSSPSSFPSPLSFLAFPSL